MEPHYKGITGTPPWAQAQESSPPKQSLWRTTWWYWAVALIVAATLVWVAVT